MKTKLVGGIAALMLLMSSIPFTAISASANEQVYAKSAPIATEAWMNKPVVKDMAVKSKPKINPCKNWLAKALKKAGFKNKGLRIAWAIAMRESGGRANAISSTGDYGVFQFNLAAHGDQPWWNTTKMLQREYNIMIAFQISQKGKTFYPWDIDGNGKHKGNYTSVGVYNKYKSWYDKFPVTCK
jgi:Lysozyme like domain